MGLMMTDKETQKSIEFKIALADTLDALDMVNRKLFLLDTCLLEYSTEEALNSFDDVLQLLKRINENYN